MVAVYLTVIAIMRGTVLTGAVKTRTTMKEVQSIRMAERAGIEREEGKGEMEG